MASFCVGEGDRGSSSKFDGGFDWRLSLNVCSGLWRSLVKASSDERSRCVEDRGGDEGCAFSLLGIGRSASRVAIPSKSSSKAASASLRENDAIQDKLGEG